jgi:hypothetical protein
MIGGETGTVSSIPDGPAGAALRREAEQYPAWRAMHGGEARTENGTTRVDGPPVPVFPVEVAGDGGPVPSRELSYLVAAAGSGRYAVAGAES